MDISGQQKAAGKRWRRGWRSAIVFALLPVLLGVVALQAWRVIELHGFYGGDAGLRDKARWSVRA